MPYTIQLGGHEYQKIEKLALARFEQSSRIYCAQYPNSLGTHIIGTSGEFAAVKGLQALNYDVIHESTTHQQGWGVDLTVNHCPVEVKTWSDVSWKKGGRCVTPDQLKKYQKKGVKAVLWLRANTHGRYRDWSSKDARRLASVFGVSFTIEGWNSVNEIARVPAKNIQFSKGQPVRNHQIAESNVHQVVAYNASTKLAC